MPRSPIRRAALAPVAAFALLAAACSDDVAENGSVPQDAAADDVPISAPGTFRQDARACLVQTIYHEARGEGRAGMIAVGAVVLNRKRSVAYPDTVCGVVRQSDDLGRCQFSWFCDGKAETLSEGDALRRAREAADALMAGADDPTGGATSFHAARVQPGWASSLRRTATIGRHVFYAAD